MTNNSLYEGDLATVMNLMGKMDGRLEFNTRLTAILNDMQALQVRSTTARLESGYNGQADLDVRLRPIQPRSAVNRQDSQLANQSAPSPLTSQVNVHQTADQSADRADDEQLLRPVLRPGSNWATVAAASSPVAVSNRFASLETMDDGRIDAQPFIEYLSRRSVKRRRRQFSQQLQQQQRQRQQQQQLGRLIDL